MAGMAARVSRDCPQPLELLGVALVIGQRPSTI
jgi:hypothetical protein